VNGIAAIGFALFATLYVVVIFYKEDFAYYDNDQLTDFSLRGRSFSPPIWPATGRFFPLGFQEFNLLALFTKSPAGFHSFAVAQLTILVLALFALLREVRFSYRVLIVATAMLAPSVAIAFTDLIYPERNVLFWLAIIMVCLYAYSKTKGSTYFVSCLIATHFVLYYKETAVVLVAGYAIGKLWLEGYLGWRAGRSWRQVARENFLPLGMLCLAGIYTMLFVVTMFPHARLSYLATQRQGLGSVLLTYAQTDWLPPILLLIFCARVWGFIHSKIELDPTWDPLALGALGYFFAVIILGLVSGYYMAPVDLIALIYAARVALAGIAKPTKLRIALVASMMTCLLLHNVAYSGFRIIERKNLIVLKSQFADFLRGYQPSGKEIELFFPYADGDHLMGLSSYLRYRGLPLVERGGTRNGDGPPVVVESPEEFPRNLCIDYRDYTCVHAESPRQGALIVILPDDVASNRDVQKIGRASVLLFSVRACGFCTSAGSWFRLLHAISPEFSDRQLPEHWLRLDVFKSRSGFQQSLRSPRYD
jgi:hypothetical protein